MPTLLPCLSLEQGGQGWVVGCLSGDGPGFSAAVCSGLPSAPYPSISVGTQNIALAHT